MYDKKYKKWISDCDTDELRRLLNKPELADDCNTLFLKASEQLSDIDKSENVVNSVSIMEKLAEKNHLPAVFAMGQMFYYGWAVSKDRKKALDFYNRAAKEGYAPAVETLADIKKAKRIKIISATVSTVLAVAFVIAGVYIAVMGTARIIKVNDQTELVTVTTSDEFISQVRAIISEYDDELVVSGQVSSNRVLLKFEGNRLDLSDFLADKVIARENNIVIIQFSDEEEAKRCLEILKNEKNIIFAEEDSYSISAGSVSEKYCSLTPVGSPDPTDQYDSWGVPDMGLDRLSEYVSKNFSDRDVVVMVIDSGARVHSAYANRYIEGVNAVTGSAVVVDEHGTHVTGTVLEGAFCDNIYVWNVDVLSGGEYVSALAFGLALEMAIDAEVDVINMSLGGPCSGYSESMIHDVIDAGITVVAAAGNDTIDSTINSMCPAHIEEVITVGAYDVNHDIAYFSNYGDCVDVCAPGVEIWSLSHLKDNTIHPLQGTSMASPHVAALAALLKAIYPDARPAEIESMICESCRAFTNEKAYSSGKYGEGAPDATVFIENY